MKVLVLSILLILYFGAILVEANQLDAQLWLQCDQKWKNEKIGTGSKTICQQGSLLTSASMVVAGYSSYWADPGILNQWLRENNGYRNQNQFVWQSIQKFGIKFGGKSEDRSRIGSHVSNNHSVIAYLRNTTGGDSHWNVITYVQDSIIITYDPIKGVSNDKIENIGEYGWYQKVKAQPSQISTSQILVVDKQADDGSIQQKEGDILYQNNVMNTNRNENHHIQASLKQQKQIEVIE